MATVSAFSQDTSPGWFLHNQEVSVANLPGAPLIAHFAMSGLRA
jgi:hypothetical protein